MKRKNKLGLCIGYVVPMLKVCGGNRIIFEHANRLSKRGVNVLIISIDGETTQEWFGFDGSVEFYSYDSDIEKWIARLDIIIATFNETLWNIIDLPEGIKKAYFVQTDERRYYDKGSLERYLATKTYEYKNVSYYTEAYWIQGWLRADFRIEMPVFPNKVENNDFYPDPSDYLKSDRKIVLVEGNIFAPKKGVRDAADALRGLDVEKWVLSNVLNDTYEKLPEYAKVFDKVFLSPSQALVRKIISSADIMLKTSYFEGSPLPHIESMCCGTAVVTTNCTGVDEYCKHLDNAFIVKVGDVNGIRDGVARLLKDDKLRSKLRENGLKDAKEYITDWDSVIDKLHDYFINLNKEKAGSLYSLNTSTRDLLSHKYRINRLEQDLHIVGQRLSRVEGMTRKLGYFYGKLRFMFKPLASIFAYLQGMKRKLFSSGKG